MVSDDGKLTLTIPAGALIDTASMRLRHTDAGFVATPGLVAGSAYALESPDLTLKIPATLSYKLGAVPATATTMSKDGTLHPLGGQPAEGPCAEVLGYECAVILGTGGCPAAHPHFKGLFQVQFGLTSLVGKFALDCEGPPDPPVPALVVLDPSTLNLGGLLDQGSGTLVANISLLHNAVLGTALDQPKLGLSADKAQIYPTDTVNLTATETGTTVFAKVAFYDAGGFTTDAMGNKVVISTSTKLGESLHAPYTLAAHVTGLPIGARVFEARALDANGNTIVSNWTTANVVAPGTLTVSLAASSTSVTAAGKVTLTATPSGGAGIGKVAFYEDTTKLGEDAAAPYTFDLAYTAASNGSHTYHAVVTDLASATATSADVLVLVNIVVMGPSYYVDAANGSDANACTAALPCKTIAKAVTGAPLGTTILMADGVYDASTQTGALAIPDGVTLKAQNPGMASVAGVTFTFAGGGGIDGLVVDTGGRFSASSATGSPILTINGVLWKVLNGLYLAGNVHANITPGTLAGGIYTSALPAGGMFIQMSGSAALLIKGGIIDGNGNGDITTGGGFIYADGPNLLTFDGVTFRNRTSEVISAAGPSAATPAVITLQSGTVFDTIGGLYSSAVVVRSDKNTTLNVTSTTVKNCSAIAFGTYYGLDHTTYNLGAGTVVKDGKGAVSSGTAVVASTVTVTGASFQNLTSYAFYATGDAILNITNSTFSGNLIDVNANGATQLKVRGSSFTSTSGNTHIGLSSPVAVDLGTAMSPGNNTFSNAAGTALTVGLVAGTLNANAVGNTWNPSVQNADAAGHYGAGTTVTSGSGRNYSISAGVTLAL